MNEKKVKIAVVGLGMMGRVHFKAYANIPDVKVVAVCDVCEEASEKLLCGTHGIRTYTDFGQMLDELGGELDMADICLPTYLHKKYCIEALEKGLHVFCEKPISNTLEDAAAIAEAAEKSGKCFGVGHVVRFFPAYRQAAEKVISGAIGVPRLIRTVREGSFPANGFKNWYNDHSLSGGTLLDLVVHDFDWIISNFGNIRRVYSQSTNNRIDGLDHSLTILRLDNGIVAHVEGSWAYPAGSVFRTGFEIIGTQGQIEYDSLKSSSLIKYRTARPEVYNPYFSCEEPYTAELSSFIREIMHEAIDPKDSHNRDHALEGTLRPVTGREAISAVEVALAARESAASGKCIWLGGTRNER